MKDNGYSIEDLRRKVASGERRAAYIEGQIANGTGPGGLSDSALGYAKEELVFIGAALLALKYHEASLRPETSVTLTLRELVDELESLDMPGQTREHDGLHRVVTKARRILSDLS